MKTVAVEATGGGILEVEPEGVSFVDGAADTGIRRLVFRLAADGDPGPVRYEEVAIVEGAIRALGYAGRRRLACETTARAIPGLNAVAVSHTIRNESGRPVSVSGIESGLFDDRSDLRVGCRTPRDLRYCHTDNVRTERFPHSQGEFPYVRNVPAAAAVELGLGEDQPFPAVYVTERTYRRGVVVAALSQNVTYQSWRMVKAAGPRGRLFGEFTIRHELPMCRDFALKPGDSLELDGTFIEIAADTHPQDAYVRFIELLAGSLGLRGGRSPLRREALFCSWNYGRFDDQREEGLLATAGFIARELPRLRYFLVDAGYQRPVEGRPGLGCCQLDGFYPEPRLNVDPAKFPRGMRAFAARIRALGLRPGIWWTPMARLDSALHAEHPDWFLQASGGGPLQIAASGYLDLTVAPARAFMDRVLATVLGEWDMDAVKMDFWSQGCEARAGVLAGPSMTAARTRTALLDLVRAHLPPDGVLVTCVAVGMGNPFMATHADSYRNTIDIGEGDWAEQLENCLWALPTLGLEGRKTWLLDADSAGINLACPDHENLFRLTWCFITMGMQEIGGRLEALPEPWVRALRRFTDRCDRGYRCRCPDEEAFTGEPFPKALCVDYPDQSPTRAAGIRQSLALFNWRDEPAVVSVARRRLGHEGPVAAADFWTGAPLRFDSAFIVRELGPRSAELYDIMA